ncbi:MAG: hypothetical protein N3A02_01605, partial [Rectinema sp.]|nr:hypothetical protein [Rectinema sp.]
MRWFAEMQEVRGTSPDPVPPLKAVRLNCVLAPLTAAAVGALAVLAVALYQERQGEQMARRDSMAAAQVVA